MKVLLIEDDLDMQNLLCEYLANFGFEVFAFANPKDGLKYAQNNKIDIVILDINLPQMNGFEVCKKLREISFIPIIISSARGNLSDKELCYEYGADDYLAKPYEPKELVLRLNALLKRSQKQSKNIIGEFEITQNEIFQDGHNLELTKIEYEIFSLLLNNKDKIISRDTIAKSINLNVKDRSIDMHISNIRAKILDDSKNPKYIKSVWDIGYKFIG